MVKFQVQISLHHIFIRRLITITSHSMRLPMNVKHGFVRAFGLAGKVVILDEADGITIDGQRALRNTMEEYSSMTRFILTANYKHKIIPAIQSRTQFFDLAPPFDDVVKRVVDIVKEETNATAIFVKTGGESLIEDTLYGFLHSLDRQVDYFNKIIWK